MKSLAKSSTGAEDGPEEGEILSDALEDISDESITFTPNNNGKSLSRSDHLQALSLSSVTDIELDEALIEKRRKRGRSYSQKRGRRKKKARRKTLDSDSSDNDSPVNSRLKLQLKAAVHVNVEEAHRNSLRTRLKAMVTSGHEDTDTTEGDLTQKEDPESTITLKTDKLIDSPITIIDLVDQDTNSCIEVISSIENSPCAQEQESCAPESAQEQPTDEVDGELMQLRLEALQTALKNKYANKKKKKKDGSEAVSSDDTNKENTSNNSEEIKKTPTNNEVNMEISPQTSTTDITPPSPDEDEDILRALLLASMSKKIVKPHLELEKNIKNTNIVTKAQNTIVLNGANNFKLNRALNNVKKNLNSVTKFIDIPKVKPLIINVNSDSDSEWELSSPEKSPKKVHKELDNNIPQGSKVAKNLIPVIEKLMPTEEAQPTKVETHTIESSVDKFLKEQRAMVESVINTTDSVTPATVTKKSESTVSVDKKVIVKPVEKPKFLATQNSTPSKAKIPKQLDLEKSALKFLPANKREEYKKLQNLLKMKKAQMKKPRVRRMSHKGNDTKNLKITVISNEMNLVTTNSKSVIKPLVKSIAPISKNTSETLVVTKPVLNNAESNVINKEINTNIVASASKIIASTLPKKATTQVQPKQQINNQNNGLINANILPKSIGSNVLPKSPVPIKLNVTVKTQSTQTIDSNVQLPPKIEVRIKEFRKQEIKAVNRKHEQRKNTLLLRNTLKQLQTKTDGRLQIHEKYRSLRPLVKKLNEVSKEQKHWDQEVENLMNNLAEARLKQEVLFNSMTVAMRNFTTEKKKIDTRLTKESTQPIPSYLVTSTPIKPASTTTAPLSLDQYFGSNTSNNDGTCNESEIKKQQTIDMNETVIEQNGKKKENEKMLNTWDQSTICNNKDADDLEVSDPNDIDNIIKRTEEKVAVLEKKKSCECRQSQKVRYVSPLDVSKRKDTVDPFGIMCPFEVNGTCKDPECTYNHLPK